MLGKVLRRGGVGMGSIQLQLPAINDIYHRDSDAIGNIELRRKAQKTLSVSPQAASVASSLTLA